MIRPPTSPVLRSRRYGCERRVTVKAQPARTVEATPAPAIAVPTRRGLHLVRFGHAPVVPLSNRFSLGFRGLKPNRHDRTIPSELQESEMPFLRAYLRASTKDQDADRALADLERFAKERRLEVAAWYVENESGAKLERPELFRLISDCRPGDVLLVEQVDRLSRLNAADWEVLKLKLAEKRIRVVSLDLPTSWLAVAPAGADEATQGLVDAVNRMLLDMLAVVARKDYNDRRRRQAQGIAKAKTAGLYRGRPADHARHQQLLEMLERGMSWSKVCDITGASRSTLSRIVAAHRALERGAS
jgi:DNA invertase Pin-like site-specific DNA recombinase